MKNKYLVLILALCSAIVYHVWFFKNSILVYGDWNYYTPKTQHALLRWLPGWTSNGLGAVNQTASFYPLDILWGLSSRLVSFGVSERVIFMIPAVLVSIVGSYLFILKLFGNKTAAFIATLFFAFNGYLMIVRTGDLTIAVAGAFIPLILWLFLITIEKGTVYLILLTAVVCSIQSFYDFRILYITMFLAAGLLFTELLGKSASELKAIVRAVTLVGIAYLLLNAYWLIGFIKLGQVTTNTSISTVLFGSEYYDLQHSLAISHPFWTLKGPTFFDKQAVPIYNWLIPVAAVLGLYFGKKNKRVLYFGVISLLGVLLTKQIAPPLTQLYLWLFDNFPGFKAFREASKFYLVTATGYSVLIAWFVVGLQMRLRSFNKWQNFSAKYIILGLLASVFMLSALPVLINNGRSLYIAKSSPNDYLLANQYLARQKGFFRTAWLPSTSWWNTYSNINPMLGISSSLSSNWKTTLDSPDPGLSLTSYNKVITDLKKPNAQQTFNVSGIRFVIIPTRDSQNDNDGFGIADRDYYVSSAEQIPWLTKVNIGTKELNVFKVKNPKPYFSSTTNLTLLEANENIANDSNFVTQSLSKEFVYTTNSKAQNSQSVSSPFGINTNYLIQPGTVQLPSLSIDQPSQLYVNQNAADYYYTANNKVVKFTQNPADSVQIDKKQPINSAIGIGLKTYDLQSDSSYYIKYGHNVYPMTSNSNVKIGNNADSLSILSTHSKNLLADQDLSHGLWQKRVEDCNNYDTDPSISMSYIVDKQLNKPVLNLKSLRHAACTGPNSLPVKAGQSLLLQFKYSVNHGKETSYRVTFNGNTHSQRITYVPVADATWRTYRGIIIVPPNATSMRIQVVSTPNEDTPKTDEVSFTDFDLRDISIQTVFDAQPYKPIATTLSAGKHELKIKDSDVSGKNLVQNPSLESGLWKKTVGDCNNHNSHGKLGMLLSSAHKSPGSKSLELYAYNHIACTGPNPVPVTQGATYEFKFDYNSPTFSSSGYRITFNDPNHTVVQQNSISEDGKTWATFKKYLTAPAGATEANITFYSVPDETANKKSINYYDNVSLIETSNLVDQIHLVGNSANKMIAPQSISYDVKSSVVKKAVVNSASGPFYLMMSEAYDPGWKLFVATKDGHEILVNSHTELNGFSNGWYIDTDQLCKLDNLCQRNPDGTYNINLIAHFIPQKYFSLGLIISLVTTFLVVITIIYSYVYNKRKVLYSYKIFGFKK